MIRLYRATCAYLEALAADLRTEHEPHPQGDNFTSAELDGREEPTEMHADHRPPAEYKIGFGTNHRRKP